VCSQHGSFTAGLVTVQRSCTIPRNQKTDADAQVPRWRFRTLPAWSSCCALCRKHASLLGATTSAILHPETILAVSKAPWTQCQARAPAGAVPDWAVLPCRVQGASARHELLAAQYQAELAPAGHAGRLVAGGCRSRGNRKAHNHWRVVRGDLNSVKGLQGSNGAPEATSGAALGQHVSGVLGRRMSAVGYQHLRPWAAQPSGSTPVGCFVGGPPADTFTPECAMHSWPSSCGARACAAAQGGSCETVMCPARGLKCQELHLRLMEAMLQPAQRAHPLTTAGLAGSCI
jgi:hypothetical protein